MKQFILILLCLMMGIVVTLGAVKYFFKTKLDISLQCGGELQKTMYCHKGYLCETNCNLCNCDAPHCQIDPSICIQPK